MDMGPPMLNITFGHVQMFTKYMQWTMRTLLAH